MNNTKIIVLITFILLSGLLVSCSRNQIEPTTTKISIQGRRFIDNQGRTVILNGLNHVEKNPKIGYINKNDELLFKQFKEWGVNCVRYGIHWDRLEEVPGVINKDYLKEIDKRVQWARENDIYLILDMHQDLYGREYGNGASPWATLDEDLPHITGSVWSDAYLMSPAVQKSFDNFWLNTPASDGVGLQDHYANAWKELAARYSDSTSVIGFDIMNEPFPGSCALNIVEKLVEGITKVLSQQELTTKASSTENINLDGTKNILELWEDEASRAKILSIIDNDKVFKEVLSNASFLVDKFEQNELSAFYQKIRDAIRETSSKQIIFLEHNYFCNMGFESSFLIPKTKNGKTDKLCAYAPHVYDLVVDTNAATDPSYNRVDAMFEAVHNSSVNRNLPIIVGEWGAFYMGKNYYKPAAHQISNIENLLAGQTYWAWWPKIEDQDYFNITIKRPYPQYINGLLKDYHYNDCSKTFVCNWRESDVASTSRIFLPNIKNIDKANIKLTPTSNYKLIPISEECNAGYLDIEYLGTSSKDRSIIIK